MSDYYNILGVNRRANTYVIKAAYRSLAKRVHPDLNPTYSEADRRIREINRAYAVLSNGEKRSRYDALLAIRREKARLKILWQVGGAAVAASLFSCSFFIVWVWSGAGRLPLEGAVNVSSPAVKSELNDRQKGTVFSDATRRPLKVVVSKRNDERPGHPGMKRVKGIPPSSIQPSTAGVHKRAHSGDVSTTKAAISQKRPELASRAAGQGERRQDGAIDEVDIGKITNANSIGRPISEPAQLRVEIVRFIEDVYLMMHQRRVADLALLYCQTVDYWGAAGLSWPDVRKSIRKYNARWPERFFKLKAKSVRVEPKSNSGKLAVRFQYAFKVSSPARTEKAISSGVAMALLDIRRVDGRWKVCAESGKILSRYRSRRSPPTVSRPITSALNGRGQDRSKLFWSEN